MTNRASYPAPEPDAPLAVAEPAPRWALQDAKARFSDLVRKARQQGPQHVTVHGRDAVVVMDADAYARLAGERTGRLLVQALQASPHRASNIEAARAPMPVRRVVL